MSRTDNTRPCQIREADKTDNWYLLPYHKKWNHHCEYCTNSERNKLRRSKRWNVKDQLDNPA